MGTTTVAQAITFQGPDMELSGELVAVHLQRQDFATMGSVRLEVLFSPEMFRRAMAHEAFSLMSAAIKGDVADALDEALPVTLELGLAKADWHLLSAEITAPEQLSDFITSCDPESLLLDIDTWFAWHLTQPQGPPSQPEAIKGGLATLWAPGSTDPLQGSLMQDLAVGLTYSDLEHELQAPNVFFVELWAEHGAWICSAIALGRTLELRSVLPTEVEDAYFAPLQEAFGDRLPAELGGAFELSTTDGILTFYIQKDVGPEPLTPEALQRMLAEHAQAFNRHIPTLEGILGPIFSES